MTEKDLLKGLGHIDGAYIEETRYEEKNKKSRIHWIRWGSIAAAVCLLFTFLLPLWNPPLTVQAEDLMEGISPQPVESVDLTPGRDSVLDFSARLMKYANQKGKNSLISPISALYALSMTANGAKGETLAEMEAVMGLPIEDLNRWLYSYGISLDTKVLNLANSIWISNRADFTVNPQFLQINANYYGADIYRAPFDNTTVRDVNRWVDHKTKGMIPEIVSKLDGSLMALINALCFEAAWEDEYDDADIRPDTFTLEDGTEKTVDYLHSVEDRFVQDDDAKGFVKYYKGGRYAFLAMLPNEGITVEQYLDSLSGESIQHILDGTEQVSVRVSIPKFETEFSVELTKVLKEMGMNAAFDGNLADFSGMGTVSDGNLVIDQVLQKTYICVDEEGTKAAAATVVIIAPTSAPITRVEQVDLDRPFVYLLMDMENGIPLFIGTMMNPTESK